MIIDFVSNNLYEWEVLIFSEFINIYPFYNICIDLVILLHTFLVIYFARYKEETNWLTFFSKFFDVLPEFKCESAISSLWSISIGVNIISKSSLVFVFLCFLVHL